MKKTIWISLLAAAGLWGATPEQVERYLLISGSEEHLIAFERMVDELGQMLAVRDGRDIPLMQDSEMIPIRFREYLQQEVSESEMDEILGNYRHEVIRKLVSAEVLMDEPDTVEAYQTFQEQIRNEPLSAGRTETVKAIIQKLYDEKLMIDFYNTMFLPMVRQMVAASGKSLPDEAVKKMGDSFVKKMQESNYQSMLFMTRDFSDEELEELNDLSGNSATSHETRAVFGAIVAAMGEAMENMARRFGDMIRRRKHPPVHPPKETNTTASPEQNTSR